MAEVKAGCVDSCWVEGNSNTVLSINGLQYLFYLSVNREVLHTLDSSHGSNVTELSTLLS